jgi:multimeric flavodoxin WrbA
LETGSLFNLIGKGDRKLNIAIISCSNVSSSGKGSISLRTAEQLKDRIKKLQDESSVHLVDLRDYRLTPCSMCEGCAETQRCVEDGDFNELFEVVSKADELMLVCPHYAPIPSKLSIILEKIGEISYLQFCAGKDRRHPTRGKKAGIIAHGGMIEGYHRLYSENILTPLTNVLESMGMKVVNRFGKEPICFGAKDFEKIDSKLPYEVVHDPDMLQASLDGFMELYKKV